MASKTYSFGYDVTIVPRQTEFTVTHTIAEIAEHYQWANGTIANDWILDYDSETPRVTIKVAHGTGVQPTYNSTSHYYTIRTSSSRYGPQYINVPNGYRITKVTLTFTKSTGSAYLWWITNQSTSTYIYTSGRETVYSSPGATKLMRCATSNNALPSSGTYEIRLSAISVTYEVDE